MLIIVGLILVTMGVVALLVGDRKIGGRIGFVTRMVSWPSRYARWLRFGCGLALIYAGTMIVLRSLGV
jgi:threonine/homoserine/homoserine lactone efflux protein